MRLQYKLQAGQWNQSNPKKRLIINLSPIKPKQSQDSSKQMKNAQYQINPQITEKAQTTKHTQKKNINFHDTRSIFDMVEKKQQAKKFTFLKDPVQSSRYDFFQNLETTRNNFMSQIKKQQENRMTYKQVTSRQSINLDLQKKYTKTKQSVKTDRKNFLITSAETVFSKPEILKQNYDVILENFKQQIPSQIIFDRIMLSLDINPYSLNVQISKKQLQQINEITRMHEEPLWIKIKFLINIDKKLILTPNECKMILKFLTSNQKDLQTVLQQNFEKNRIFLDKMVDMDQMELFFQDNPETVQTFIKLIVKL